MMTRLILVISFLLVATSRGEAVEPTATQPPGELQDLAKKVDAIDKRVVELETTSKSLERLIVTDVTPPLKSVDMTLADIRAHLKDDLKDIATNTKTTFSTTFWILIVAITAMIGSALTGEVYRRRLRETSEDLHSITRALPRRAAPPMIFALQPQRGPTTGGTLITIRGQNFQLGAVVRFHGTLATNVNVISAQEVSAVSPPGVIGQVDVTLENRDGERDTLPAFTYTPPAPIVRVVTPSPAAAGTPIIVCGANFQQGSIIEIGGHAIATTFGSENHLTGLAPAGEAGQTVAVAVSNPDGQQSNALAQGFQFQA